MSLRARTNPLLARYKYFLGQLSAPQNIFLAKQQLISYVRNKCTQAGYSSAIYLGSGVSALQAIEHSDGFFVIGGNLTCLLPIYQHLYFSEWSGSAHSNLLPHLLDIYRLCSARIGFHVIKGLSQSHNSIALPGEHAASSIFLKEYSVPIMMSRDIMRFIRLSICPRSSYMVQSLSSVLTAVSLAYLSGLQSITLYGVDFVSGYFWDVPASALMSLGVSPIPSTFPRGYRYGSEVLYPTHTNKLCHEVESSTIPLSQILGIYIKYLDSLGFKVNFLAKN